MLEKKYVGPRRMTIRIGKPTSQRAVFVMEKLGLDGVARRRVRNAGYAAACATVRIEI
jgi:hypothetical protein